jgi:hypothetical protein
VDSPALFKTVTRYDMNFSTGEWYKKEVQEYEYENGYPVLIKYHDFDSDMDWQYSYEYSFNGELPVEMKEFDQDGILTRSAIYDENGRRDRDYYYSDSGNGTTERVYQYGNRDQYFTMVHHETLCKYPEEPDTPDEHAEEVDSVIVTRENDLLKKTVNDGLFANWADGQAKEWYRFMGSYTAEYDENGIAKELLSEYDDVSTNSKDRYDIMVEDGKVTEVVCRKYVTSDEPDGMAFTKYEFEYSDVEISQARYASMINYIIMEGGGTFYIFNWN